jgi:Domain of unknown function (DUF6378)
MSDIYTDSKNLIYGDRHKQYGSAKDNFTDIGKIWGVILGIDSVPPEKVALCMAGLKLAREKNKHQYDNLLDGISYIALANDIINTQPQPK